MTKRYVTRLASIYEEPDAEHYLSREVHEPEGPRATGLLDWTGAKIFEVNEMEPIGFVRHNSGGQNG